MIVAIDAGNTRTKWAVFDASGTILHQGVVENTQLDRWTDVCEVWTGCRRVVLSNVAGPTVVARVRVLCEVLHLPLLVIRATASACGVSNGYHLPDQLGSDRWAALVSAWHLTRAPCVVATAGTALTVDALSSQGEFLGGLIMPGRRMMQAALAAGTANLAVQDGQRQAFPLNTADAICSGAWVSMAGAVEQMYANLQAREGCAPRCLLSGGDAPGLLEALSSPAEIADNLVLHGLWLIERESA